ncbi:Protein of unknown function [Halomonas shengliensis]|uniref:DUF3999 domain-containing protein n=1 Tax=Halomonas shengliensis TaxID=419597 RepID=A0A1H0G7W9_9GAMM|nr:DUF3999 domain-containing protein [Halomonas shengliensis]SDO02950.1 Protein of unknown function [Halomonas shengliensis]
MRRLGYLALLAWPTLLGAGTLEEEWRHAWPLEVEAPAAAYRLTLTPEVYRSLHTPALADLQVVDARGRAVPTRVEEEPAPAPSERLQPVAWFPLPPPPSDTSRWELIGETDASGRLRRIESRGSAGDDAARRDRDASGAALVDLSGLDGPVAALSLHWDAEAPVDSLYRVEASDDLEEWRPLLARGRLLEVAHDGQRLVRRRLELGATSARYLRLRPLPGQPPIAFDGVEAVMPASPAARESAWALLDGERLADGEFHYRLAGRPPVSLADVVSDTPYAARWRLESREAPDAPWRTATRPWTGYRLGEPPGELRSLPQALDETRRDRHWRLLTDTTRPGPPPRLRLGYTPERVVFLAEGEAPWRLVAGSAQAVRQPAAVAAVLESLRARHGEAWQPAGACLGARETLAGETALTPPRDWTRWLLWGVLIAGTLLVGGLALRLLRRSDAT